MPVGLNTDLGRDRAEELSRIAAAGLGWTDMRRLQELQDFEDDTALVYRRPQDQSAAVAPATTAAI